MAFVGPLDSFNSQPIQTKVGKSQTNIFTATSTKVTKDSNGKVTGGTTTLYYSPTAGNYVPAAKTTDGGKTWTYLKDSSGKDILGTDAKTSLQQGALKNNTQAQIVAATTKPLGGGLSPDEQKVVAPSTQNSASGTAGTGDQTSTVAPESLTQAQALSDKDIAYAADVRLQYAQLLTYPITRDPKQDYIKFSMFKYEPRKVAAGQGGDEFGGRGENRVPIGNVALPIQPTISDSNVVQWGEDRIDALTMTAGKFSLAVMQGNVDQGISEAGQTVEENAGAIKSQVMSSLASAAVGTNANLFTRLTGAIVNPNLELLFQGPSLRSFSFTFSMSARETREAEEIKKIIRFFKQGMSVKRAAASLYLKSPHTFGISYIYNGQGDHPWINRVKECALTNCSVNYTPAGNYATYEDGAMTQYDLSLTFGELEPIYDDDYGKIDGNADTQIGY